MSAAILGSLIPSLVGLGAQIGTAIPALRKPKRTRAAQQAATQAARQVAGAAISGAQAGHGATRGLRLRMGLRSAGEAAQRASQAQAAAGLADEQFYQQQLLDRNTRLAEFGTNVASGLADMAAGLVQPGATGGVQAAQQKVLQQQPEMAPSPTGLGSPAAAMVPQRKALESEALAPAQGAPDLQALEQEAGIAPQAGPQEAGIAPQAGPAAQFQSGQALERLRAAKPTTFAPEIEADLENRLQAKKLMLQDAERLGISLDGVMSNLNRRLGLVPGQSVQNPYGVRLDLEG